MKKILVTGCCGFIGSHLCDRLLVEGYEVHGIDNFDPFYPRVIKQNNLNSIRKDGKFKFFEVDIREANFEKNMDYQKYDAIIHLAAKVGVLSSITQTSEYIETNITGTLNLLNYMKKADVNKLLFASSSSVYGNNANVPFNENESVNEPISPYAFTKKSCELINYTYHHLYNIDVINLRLFTVYGPRQRPDLAIFKFTNQIDTGQNVCIYGDGTTYRDYTYIDDVINGFTSALSYIFNHNNTYEIVNIGNGHPIEIKTLIDIIGNQLNKTPSVTYKNQQPGDVNGTYADISKAQLLLDYNPGVAIEKGIENFVRWYINKK